MTSYTETRSHRGLIAVASVLASAALLWLFTVGLARASARAHIAAEVARQLEADRIKPPDEPARAPAPSDDAMTLLRGREADQRTEASASTGEFGGADDLSYLELVRAAARRPALWISDPYPGAMMIPRDFPLVRRAAERLGRAAIENVRAGDDDSARDDIACLLRFREGLELQQLYEKQLELTVECAAALGVILAETRAPAHWSDLDSTLAAIDPEPNVARCLRATRSNLLRELADERPSGLLARSRESEHERFWHWPESETRCADMLDELQRFESALPRGLPALIATPGFEWRARQGASCLPSPPTWTDWRGWMTVVPVVARERLLVLLMRAALRARLESAESARMFLAGLTEPFTGGPFHARTNADGSWTAWCSVTPHAPASADGPHAVYDLVWPPKP